MKRWNGWGDISYHYPLSENAHHFLSQTLGTLTSFPDATFEDVLQSVPPSRLSEHPLIVQDVEERLLHARGQSLPDWVALRSGRIGVFPDGVAYPKDNLEVRDLLTFARHRGASLIPYGGGTSVVGHINPPPGDIPVLTLDISRLNRLLQMDEVSRLATFEAGVHGPDLERQLQARGYTLGHFPQSFEQSTLGGWIATRSSGQQSYHYGRIEALFSGGVLETPQGSMHLPDLPASAAGPDLRHLVLGSEGRLGIITQASVRVRPLPEAEAFFGIFFSDWPSGIAAVRQAAQENLAVCMLRLSNPQETETTLLLSGKDTLVALARRGLNLFGYGPGCCLLIFGVTGRAPEVQRVRRQMEALGRRWRGLPTGSLVGKTWKKSRFLTPYLRNTLWERGVAIDTLETAVTWLSLEAAAVSIQTAIQRASLELNEKVLVLAHLSHVYVDGASLYVTYLFRRREDPQALIQHWSAMKQAASQAILDYHGTISHQHGVGVDHASYLDAEKSLLGIKLLKAAIHTLDPQGTLNPGKLILEDDSLERRA